MTCLVADSVDILVKAVSTIMSLPLCSDSSFAVCHHWKSSCSAAQYVCCAGEVAVLIVLKVVLTCRLNQSCMITL